MYHVSKKNIKKVKLLYLRNIHLKNNLEISQVLLFKEINYLVMNDISNLIGQLSNHPVFFNIMIFEKCVITLIIS